MGVVEFTAGVPNNSYGNIIEVLLRRSVLLHRVCTIGFLLF